MKLFVTGCWLLRDSHKIPSLSTESAKLSSLKEDHFQGQNSQDKDDSMRNEQFRQFGQFIVDLLERVKNLEEGNVKQTESLSNVTQSLGDITEHHNQIWKLHNEKLNRLEELLRQENVNANIRGQLETMKLEFQSLHAHYEQTKLCCDAQTQIINKDEIEEHVDSVLKGYFGNVLSKDEWSTILQKVVKIHDDETLGKSSSKVDDIDLNQTNLNVRKIVKDMIKIYDADKTGRVDYALESAGGQIISTRCTQRYDLNTRAFKLLGWTLFYESSNPRTVIQGHPVQPGICWAFQDFPGYLLVRTRSLIYVTGFTIEHAPKSILPNGDMRSAPRKFNVWGLKDENDPEPVMFGEYEFLNSDENLQYFPVQNATIKTSYNYVELRIHSNHGQLKYTCLYRFRIHGNSV